jgi:hypothetical protein
MNEHRMGIMGKILCFLIGHSFIEFEIWINEERAGTEKHWKCSRCGEQISAEYWIGD